MRTPLGDVQDTIPQWADPVTTRQKNTCHRNVNYRFPLIRWSSVLRRRRACVPVVPEQTLGFVSCRRFSETASLEQISIGMSDS